MKNWIEGAINKNFIASYSGGKDSTLALYKAMKKGTAVGIVVMMEEEGDRSRAHSLFKDILKAQAKAIGVPLYTGSANFKNYEKVFVEILKNAKDKGAEVLVTGDIDLPEEDCWHERVTNSIGLKLGVPLWKRDHKEVVKEFISLGFKTKVITIDTTQGMKEEDLGRILTFDYMKELEERGIDSCGENGEFHTVTIGGPIFKEDIKVEDGEITSDGRYMYLKIELK
ncbi:diphthine--ammonia ligase [Clostridium sp. LY3-2]|uniref:Dph6-related ATP pyrophosphatase n=1 Tax=Clostridium sp. LY3-2 TaxID=2942482 RepID=UPI0021528EFC|nr:diphthine--ammonia ligase [Clostridium sp. LY3-2]MCR6516173.1 diphthine--ammonia ligase [Clostridium sp. LY3-2]